MKSVLVIDDELDVRDAIQRVLTRAGYSVRNVGTAEFAFAELKQIPADLVITDIIMPQSNGIDVINTLRQQFPGTRILAISGGGNFGVKAYQPGSITTTAYLAAAQKAGAHHILTKPFESKDLLQAVESAIGAHAG